MSESKTRVTVTLDPHLVAYAESMVGEGKAPSVSAVVNDALEARQLEDQEVRRIFREAAERADPEKVDRMLARLDEGLAATPGLRRAG